MGLFDFLHGGTVISEAEMYMRSRNKEYARKCEMYRKRDEKIIKENHRATDIRPVHSNSVNAHNTRITRTSKTIVDAINTVCAGIDECANAFAKDTPVDSAIFSVTFVENENMCNMMLGGMVTKGGFKTGDKATINGNEQVIIKGMVRKGSQINYANVSSGYINIIIETSDRLIKPGDEIIKRW